MKRTKKCLQCEKEFVASKLGGQRYCAPTCRVICNEKNKKKKFIEIHQNKRGKMEAALKCALLKDAMIILEEFSTPEERRLTEDFLSKIRRHLKSLM